MKWRSFFSVPPGAGYLLFKAHEGQYVVGVPPLYRKTFLVSRETRDLIAARLRRINEIELWIRQSCGVLWLGTIIYAGIQVMRHDLTPPELLGLVFLVAIPLIAACIVIAVGVNVRHAKLRRMLRGQPLSDIKFTRADRWRNVVGQMSTIHYSTILVLFSLGVVFLFREIFDLWPSQEVIDALTPTEVLIRVLPVAAPTLLAAYVVWYLINMVRIRRDARTAWLRENP